MKRFSLSLVPVLALGLCALACEKKEETPATTPPATEPLAAQPASPAQAPTTTTVAATTVDVSTLPVSEEFEEEAEKEVTAANIEQKLDTIEKEIQTE